MRDLLNEVFGEYGLPIEIDGDVPLIRNRAVATLIRAINLAAEGFPFAGVTSLLRSTFFRPDWPEADGDMARRGEGLLRMLGLARDRDAYLQAIRLWAETPPEGLEDEQAEESRRLRKARIAADCRPFLERFFQAWDGLPSHAEPTAFTEWVRDFAVRIGLWSQAERQPVDANAIHTLLSAMERTPGSSMSWTVFSRSVVAIALTENSPRTDSRAGCIRVVMPEEARSISCDYMFILGLGENSFPRLGAPLSLLDDADRIALRSVGLPLADPAARLGDEKQLFLQLIGRPRRELILSYPATDQKGQPLLPGSFLRAVADCFAPGVLKPEHQRMLIEGYTTQPAAAQSEARVQFAQRMRDSESGSNLAASRPASRSLRAPALGE